MSNNTNTNPLSFTKKKYSTYANAVKQPKQNVSKASVILGNSGGHKGLNNESINKPIINSKKKIKFVNWNNRNTRTVRTGSMNEKNRSTDSMNGKHRSTGSMNGNWHRTLITPNTMRNSSKLNTPQQKKYNAFTKQGIRKLHRKYKEKGVMTENNMKHELNTYKKTQNHNWTSIRGNNKKGKISKYPKSSEHLKKLREKMKNYIQTNLRVNINKFVNPEWQEINKQIEQLPFFTSSSGNFILKDWNSNNKKNTITLLYNGKLNNIKGPLSPTGDAVCAYHTDTQKIVYALNTKEKKDIKKNKITYEDIAIGATKKCLNLSYPFDNNIPFIQNVKLNPNNLGKFKKFIKINNNKTKYAHFRIKYEEKTKNEYDFVITTTLDPSINLVNKESNLVEFIRLNLKELGQLSDNTGLTEDYMRKWESFHR